MIFLPVCGGTGLAVTCNNQQVCQNCGTLTHEFCPENVISPSTAEQCLEETHTAELSWFDQHGKCRTYSNANCLDVNSSSITGSQTRRSVYGGWASRLTCTTGMWPTFNSVFSFRCINITCISTLKFKLMYCLQDVNNPRQTKF